MTYRLVASAFLGIILFLVYFWRFLPYSLRERSEYSPNWWSFLIIVLVGGFLLSLGLPRRRFWVPTCLLLTLFVANTTMIVVDCIRDPTSHNLLPFEFIMIAVFTLPSYFGALIAAAVDRFTARGIETRTGG